MKTFKDVLEEQIVPEWMVTLLKELDSKGYAVEDSYWNRTVYIFGSELPKSLGYDELDIHLGKYTLSATPYITSIQGNPVIATIEYRTDKLTELGIYFDKQISKNANYSQDMGNDGNHPSGWSKVK